MRTQEYKFKQGQKVHLDEIYEIMNLFDGDWFDQKDPYDAGVDEEDITITRDVHFVLTDKCG